MKSSGNMLKVLAMRAKNRMINKNGYDARIKIVSNDDSEFVERVRELLNTQEDVLNPIARLMEDKVLTKLDEKGKEKYLLEVAEKYLKAKNMIEKEKLA